MADWHSLLNADPTDWLLEDDNPSVRYSTLRDILGKPEADSEVLKAKADIMTVGHVPAILAAQDKSGSFGDPKSFYTAKYSGTVWQLIILAELGANPNNEQIKKACEFILDNSQHKESGGFSAKAAVKTEGGLASGVYPCLTGNMAWALIRFGYLDDPRLRKAIGWMTTYQRYDDGNGEPPQVWPYNKDEMCWGRHTCHMGVVKMLKALAEIPEDKRSPEVKKAIEAGAEFMLIHHIHKQSHNLKKDSKPGWKKLGFPLMYQTDVLEVLGILTRLGYRDERMQEAVDLLVSKQDAQGRWKMENNFNGHFIVDIEEIGKPSKWVTLNALRVLKNYYR
jgi:hypothetical protein